MPARTAIIPVLAACLSLTCGPASAQTPGHVTGLGGVFVTSPNPKALAAWYRDVLGLHVESWGGAMLRYDAPGHPPMALWSAFPPNASEFAASRRDFMVNFAVDDMDAVLARLHKQGITEIKRTDDPTGRFAWLLDPDGTKIELWQPKPK